MFSSKPKIKTQLTAIDSMISKGTEVMGPINFRGGLKVTGKIGGDVTGIEDGKAESSISVDPTGVIQGNVSAGNVIIAGTVYGDITAKSVCILETAYVQGSITYDLLQMEAGAQVQGTLKSSVSTNNNTTTEPRIQDAA